MDDEFFEKLREKVLPYFEKGDGHGFDHVDRVYRLALNISEDENVDLDVVRAAVLLHDVARSRQRGGNICHAEEGSKMSVEILKDVGFPEDKIDAVVHAVAVHRWSEGLKAKTKEAEILQDADRLDSIGAIAVARVFEGGVRRGRSYCDSGGGSETSIDYIKKKCLNINLETFNTLKAGEIAKSRYEYIRDFVDRFEGEWRGDL